MRHFCKRARHAVISPSPAGASGPSKSMVISRNTVPSFSPSCVSKPISSWNLRRAGTCRHTLNKIGIFVPPYRMNFVPRSAIGAHCKSEMMRPPIVCSGIGSAWMLRPHKHLAHRRQRNSWKAYGVISMHMDEEACIRAMKPDEYALYLRNLQLIETCQRYIRDATKRNRNLRNNVRRRCKQKQTSKT